MKNNIEPNPDVTKVFENVRKLVQEKTRFDTEEVSFLFGKTTSQSYSFTLNFQLSGQRYTQQINGYFPTKENIEIVPIENPEAVAEAETADRLQQASSKLHEDLKNNGTKFSAVQEGCFLPAVQKYYNLHSCNTCGGAGKNTCNTCYGHGSHECGGCHGKGHLPCNNVHCVGGRATCSKCYGSCRVQVSVPYQESYTAYNSSGSYTAYRTSYRNEYHPCSCYQGRVTCNICYGNGKLSCYGCSSTGIVTCGTCGATGTVTCAPCSGSGQTGIASWLDIELKKGKGLLKLTGDVDGAAPDCVKKDLLAIPGISSGFAFEESKAEGAYQEIVQGNYTGTFDIHRLGVQSAGKTYEITAFGSDHRWLTLDNLVENLLEQDLEELETAVAASKQDGFLSTKVTSLLAPLGNAISSEVNLDLLSGSAGSAASSIPLSSSFNNRITNAITHAVRTVYRRIAVDAFLIIQIVTVIAYLTVSYISPSATFRLVPALFVTFVAWVYFSLMISNCLKHAVPDNHQRKLFSAVIRERKLSANTYPVLLAIVLLEEIGVLCLLPNIFT